MQVEIEVIVTHRDENGEDRKVCHIKVKAQQDKDKSPIEAYEEAFLHTISMIKAALN